MYTWIIYDISDNKQRLTLSRRCKHMGLLRVQKSVFLGQANDKKLKEFNKEASKFIKAPDDRLFIVPMNQAQYAQMTRLGADVEQAHEHQRISGKAHTLFF